MKIRTSKPVQKIKFCTFHSSILSAHFRMNYITSVQMKSISGRIETNVKNADLIHNSEEYPGGARGHARPKNF